MTGSGSESGLGTWGPPECPFKVEYSERVLDDIRLAIVDAFFSLPRGGAEIGGVLLGTYANRKVTILDYEALDCEHAMGPSFNLSARDQSLLSDMVLKKRPDSARVVGWYHSHTRSEIFLNEADQDVHKRFFREPWQVALVLKPHIFEATRGGFFFTGTDGSIRATASYQEFVLEGLPMRPVPSGAPVMEAQPHPLRTRPDPQGPVITLTPEVNAPPPAHPTHPAPPTPPAPEGPQPAAVEEVPVAHDVPAFLQIAPQRNTRWLKIVAGVALVVAAGATGYQTRDAWFPAVQAQAAPLVAKIKPALPKAPTPYLALAASSDQNGQVQIRWDRNSPAVRQATEAVLEIRDGDGSPQAMKLDAAHLQAGIITYGRQKERVEIALIVRQSNGERVKEATAFVGQLPEHKPPPEDPQVRMERDQLRAEAVKLRTDLGQQQAKTRKLEKDVNDLRDQLLKEQKRRLGNQLTDPGKQDQF